MVDRMAAAKVTAPKGRVDVTKHETVKAVVILKPTLSGQTVRSPMKSNGLPKVPAGGREQTPTVLRKSCYAAGKRFL